MTTYTKTGDAGSAGHSAIKRVPYLIENTVDMSSFDPSHSPADTVQVINVPAETFVLSAGMETLTASTSSVTWTLGDGSDPNRYVTATEGTAAAGHKAVVAHASNTGAVYSSADTLDLVTGGAQDTAGKVRVWAIMCDISGVDETDRN
tara:strand:- start:117 stop:560 length:444 start_codon:yes stop_codon:yes gene_type:complete